MNIHSKLLMRPRIQEDWHNILLKKEIQDPLNCPRADQFFLCNCITSLQ